MKREKSQSLNTDQVNSNTARFEATSAFEEKSVSIPQYRSGQFQPASGTASLVVFKIKKSLNPSIPIRSIPTAALVSPWNRETSEAQTCYLPVQG